jgi:hypothetical protein
MKDVYDRIMGKGVIPSMPDIAELLTSIGPPGEKRAEKEAAVRRLFDELGVRAVNNQGHHLADSLSGYPQY